MNIVQQFSNLTRTLRAPSDVTSVAGANAYAAKLAASPIPTETHTIMMHIILLQMIYKNTI